MSYLIVEDMWEKKPNYKKISVEPCNNGILFTGNFALSHRDMERLIYWYRKTKRKKAKPVGDSRG